MKQEKLFSSIYIIGTGLSIAVIILLSIVFYIRIANIYPESHRDRMLIVQSAAVSGEGYMSCSGASYHFAQQCFYSLQSAEAVTAVYYNWGQEHYIQPAGESYQMPVVAKYIDPQFWAVFPFRFIEGKSFSEEDMESGVRTAVISETLARMLFGNQEAAGEFLSLNYESYRIAGVVKDAPAILERTYADLWIPYTVISGYKDTFSNDGSLGSFEVYMLAHSKRELGKVKEEALQNVQRYGSQLQDVELTLNGQPDRHWESIFRNTCNNPIDFKKIAWQYGLILLLLLLIPAISLSGMTDSRMERRMAETGVRRAFGAPQKTLMMQVFTENFLFTLLGGLLGLLLSYFLFYVTQDWIMNIGKLFVDIPIAVNNSKFSWSMFFNPWIFLIALAICFILNFLSAFIPAWRASRKEIVSSIHQVKQ